MWALFMIRNVKKQRPVNLDLQTIRFPITAIASILHRVSGVITFVAVGILLWLLGTSLSSPEGFEQASAIMGSFFVKFIMWGILTALAYHVVVGIRHMMMDLAIWKKHSKRVNAPPKSPLLLLSCFHFSQESSYGKQRLRIRTQWRT